MANGTSFYYREDTSLIQASVAGVFGGAQFTSIEGGDAEVATEQVRPGNMEPSVAISGIVTPQDVTLEVQYTDSTALWLPGLKRAAKSGAEVSAMVTPKDGDGNPNAAAALKWAGVLKTVGVPKRDAKSSAAAMIKIVFTPDEEEP